MDTGAVGALGEKSQFQQGAVRVALIKEEVSGGIPAQGCFAVVPVFRGNVGMATADEAGSGVLRPIGQLAGAGIGLGGPFRAAVEPSDERFR